MVFISILRVNSIMLMLCKFFVLIKTDFEIDIEIKILIRCAKISDVILKMSGNLLLPEFALA